MVCCWLLHLHVVVHFFFGNSSIKHLKRIILTSLKMLLVLAARYLHLFRWLPRELRIVMYHGIGCSGFSEESFDLQMKFISKYFETYWVSDAVSLLSDGSNCSSKKPPIILTFDDGLSNNMTTAAPILEKYGLKATFFVCSDLMGGKSMLWNHELRCRLQLLRSETVYKISNGQCAGNSEQDVSNFVELVKCWPNDKVKNLLSLLRKDCPEPSYSAQMLQDYLIMSAEDMCRLPAGVEIGSHTKSHPILDSLSKDEIESQIVNSKSELTRMLGRDVDVFCYPNGVTNTFCHEVVSKTYKVAVTTNEGFASCADGFHLLNRIPSAGNLQDLVWRFIRPTA